MIIRENYYLSNSAILIFIIYCLITYDTFNNNFEDAITIDNNHYAFGLTIAILIYPFEKVIKRGFKALIEADVLLVTSFIYWSLLDILQSRYPLTTVTPYAVKMTFIYLALFILFVQIGSQYQFKLPRIIKEASIIELSTKTLFGLVITCFVLGIFYFWKSSYYDFWYMIDALDRPRFKAPWARGVTGGIDSIIEHFKYFGYILPCLFVLMYLKEGKFTSKVIITLILAIFFSAFEFQGGGRRITGFLVGVACITYLVSVRNRLKVSHFIFMAIIAGGLLVLLDMQLAFRNKGYQGMFEKYEIEQLDEIRVDDNFFRIAQLIDNIPEVYPWAGMQYFIYSLGRPIPRFFWPSKPLTPGYDVATIAGEYGVTLTTTVVGEAYASYGVMAIIFMGVIYGIIAGSIKKLLYLNLNILGYALYAIATLALVGGVRALVDMIIFSYAFLGLLVLYRYYLRDKAYLSVNHA